MSFILTADVLHYVFVRPVFRCKAGVSFPSLAFVYTDFNLQ